MENNKDKHLISNNSPNNKFTVISDFYAFDESYFYPDDDGTLEWWEEHHSDISPEDCIKLKKFPKYALRNWVGIEEFIPHIEIEPNTNELKQEIKFNRELKSQPILSNQELHKRIAQIPIPKLKDKDKNKINETILNSKWVQETYKKTIDVHSRAYNILNRVFKNDYGMELTIAKVIITFCNDRNKYGNGTYEQIQAVVYLHKGRVPNIRTIKYVVAKLEKHGVIKHVLRKELGRKRPNNNKSYIKKNGCDPFKWVFVWLKQMAISALLFFEIWPKTVKSLSKQKPCLLIDLLNPKSSP